VEMGNLTMGQLAALNFVSTIRLFASSPYRLIASRERSDSGSPYRLSPLR